MGKVKATSTSKDLIDRIASRLIRGQPETAEGGTYDVARSRDDAPSKIRYVVTTGIRPFDDRVGGMPIGKAIELCGLPSSGKTNMAVRTCVRAQQGFIYERTALPNGQYHLEQLKPGTYQVTTLYYDNEGSLSDIDKRTIEKFEKEAAEMGKSSFKYAWVLDKHYGML